MTYLSQNMNQSGRATAGNAAAAGFACPQSRRAGFSAFVMDAACFAASIFVILVLTSLLVSLAVSILGILVLVCLISLLILMWRPRSLKNVNPAT